MSKPKIVEIKSSNPATYASLEIVAYLVSEGVQFVPVPCFTGRQEAAAGRLVLEHLAASTKTEAVNH